LKDNGAHCVYSYHRHSSSSVQVVKRADLFRFLVIWLYGGIYADLDIGAKAADVTSLPREAQNTIIWEPFWAQDNYHIAPLAPSRQDVQTNTRHLRHDGRLVLIAFLAAQARGSDFIAFVLARQV
jgi:mannosyltransferase OCH1-like enzyme